MWWETAIPQILVYLRFRDFVVQRHCLVDKKMTNISTHASSRRIAEF